MLHIVFNPELQQEKFHLFKKGIAIAEVSWGHVFSASKPCNTNMILRLHLIGCPILSASDCVWDCCPICDSLSSHQGAYLLQIFLETETYSLNSTSDIRCLNIMHRRLQKTILCNEAQCSFKTLKTWPSQRHQARLVALSHKMLMNYLLWNPMFWEKADQEKASMDITREVWHHTPMCLQHNTAAAQCGNRPAGWTRGHDLTK
jgi:hypothetical protein